MRHFVRTVLPQHQSRSPQLLADIAKRGMEAEIESDRLVVVGGDGVEAPVSYGDMQDYASHKINGSELIGVHAGDEMSELREDIEDAPSWIRSGLRQDTPSWEGKATINDKGSVNHIENSDLRGIPYLSLTPTSSTTPSPCTSNVALPSFVPKRPPISTTSSTTSTESSSSFRSPAAVSPSPTASPRRIQSTSSLLSVSPGRQCSSYSDAVRNDVNSAPNSPHHRFSFDLFKQALGAHHRSRSGTMISPRPLSPVPDVGADPVLPSPSIRKRRLSSGLTMASRRGNKAASMWVTTSKTPSESHTTRVSHEKSTAAMSGVKTLVDEWTRSGPANKTVMVSVQPAMQYR